MKSKKPPLKQSSGFPLSEEKRKQGGMKLNKLKRIRKPSIYDDMENEYESDNYFIDNEDDDNDSDYGYFNDVNKNYY